MSKQLSLDRDFTRFLNDPTFPYKVTVCIGNERILCSGALLAQQSSVLERKMREDDGVLIFEEMLDVENKNNGLHACIRFLHGADMNIRFEDFTVILKFASFYEVKGLFEEAMKWLRHHLKTSRSVRDAIQYLKLSNCFHNSDNTKKLKSEIQFFIRSNKDIFCSKVIENLDSEIAGFDIINIINEDLVNSAQILKKWASFSNENRSYIIKNHSNFDLIKLFRNEEEFSSFICLISDGTSSAESFKALLDLQKAFFTLKLSQSSEPNIGKSEAKDNVGSSGSGLNPNPASSVPSFFQNKVVHGESSSNMPQADRPSDHIGVTWPRCELEANVRCQSSPTFPINRAEFSSEATHNEIVIVYNLPSRISKRRLIELFSFAGRVRSVKMFPGKSQAHVTFEDVASAHILLKHNYENRFIIDDKRVELHPEFDDDVWSNKNYLDEQVLIWEITPSTSKTKLRKLFSFAGRIASIDILTQDFYAVITYHNVSSANTVRASNRSFNIDGVLLCISHLVTSSSESSEESSDETTDDEFNETRLYIGNIPDNADEEQLKRMFCGYGRIVELDIIRRGNRGVYYGFITFENFRSAQSLLQGSLKRNFTYGGYDLRIERVKSN